MRILTSGRLLLSIFLLLAASAPAVTGQDTAEAAYVDVFLERYIELEQRLLGDDVDLEQAGYDIRKFRFELEGHNRPDLISRLDMLDFVVRTRLELQIVENGGDQIVAEIIKKEELRKSEETGEDFLNIMRMSTGIAAVSSAVLFFTSTFISIGYNEQSDKTNDTPKKLELRGIAEIFELAAMITGISAVSTTLGFGILIIID